MERAVPPAEASLRWQPFAQALIGALLLAGALALGGGGALFAWALGALAGWPGALLVAAALYCVPGLLLLRLCRPKLAWAARSALALGVSVALPPLLLLLFQQLGLPWGAGATWVYLLLCVLALAGLALRDWHWPAVYDNQQSAAGSESVQTSHDPNSEHIPAATHRLDAPALALLGITLAALLVRQYAARDLRVGLLGDSYQHTLMAQLLADHRGLFQSWQPYAPLTTFTYHFGFHANVVFFHHLTGVDIPRSVVVVGQLMSALAAPLAFALAVALGGSRWAGAWAALIVGFLAHTPAFFVNWGRYTQLTGQVVMLAALVCWVALLENQEPRTKNQEPNSARSYGSQFSVLGSHLGLALLTALLTAALMLTHYLVTALAALAVLSFMALRALALREWRAIGRMLLRAGPTAALALLLALPWLLNVLRGQLLRNANGLVTGGAGRAVVSQLSALEPVVPRYLGGGLLALALAGLLCAAWRRDWRMALPALWAALFVIAVVPYVAGLPGAGVIDSITGLGSLYIPVALLGGYAVGVAFEQLEKLAAQQNQEPRTKNRPSSRQQRFSVLSSRFYRVPHALAALLLAALLAANTGWQAQIVRDETALVSQADLAAIEWIKANTPPDARFLVNSFPAYGGTLAAGTDAGWWLPLLAGRWASLPPLTYGSERGERVNYQKHLNNFIAALRGRALSDPRPIQVDLTRKDALAAIRSAGATYIYNGAHPFPGPAAADRFDSAILRASPLFRLVYDRDGVEIYQVISP